MPKTSITINLANEGDTIDIATKISATAASGDVVALFGDLGSGKTVFARAFINARTATFENVPSPTFTLLQTYEFPDPSGTIPVYHFDLYRIERTDEIEELGMDEAFVGGISLVEWPERLNGRLPGNRLDIFFTQGEHPNQRQVILKFYGSWTSRMQSLITIRGKHA